MGVKNLPHRRVFILRAIIVCDLGSGFSLYIQVFPHINFDRCDQIAHYLCSFTLHGWVKVSVNIFRILNVMDEYTRECLGVRVERRLTHKDFIEVLYELFCTRGVPVHIRSDNGSEFTAQQVRNWLAKLLVKHLFIEPGSPWENGYNESFNGKMRDELLAGEIFYSLKRLKY